MHALPLALALALPFVAACGDDTKPTPDTSPDATDTVSPDSADTADVSDTTIPVPPEAVFAFRAAPGQSISEGPFPNQGLVGDDGLVALAPLKSDPRFGTLSRADLLDRTDAQIAKKSAFGYVSAVFFPMNAEPDLASFEGRVRFVSFDGLDAGAAFPGQVAWFAPARYLVVFPAWGHYLTPGSLYGVVIESGPTTADGTAIAPPPAFAALVAASVTDPDPETTRARTAFSPLREHLATVDGTAVIGTVFRTEDPRPWFDSLIERLSSWPLEPASRTVAFTTAGAPIEATDVGPDDLAAYFGTPSAPFTTTPTAWAPGTRAAAAALTGGTPYTGGSFHGRVSYVVNGSLVMPSLSTIAPSADVVSAPIVFDGDGEAVVRSRVLVPFSAFFCDVHVKDGALDPDATVPFAIFTHGGTALRSDALAFATANCEVGYATIALDLPFHGGRQDLRKDTADGEELIVPVRVDDENVYTGKRRGDPGFVPDRIGDNGAATTSVGSLFGLATTFDPDILEANLIAISLETYVLTRYLRDPHALADLFGVTIDADRLVLQSLSFGTSFTTAALTSPALGASAVVQSVGSGGMFTLNLPMAPNNASLASGILFSLLSLKSTIPELIAGAWRDPFLALIQWLSQRGDPQGYAPFVLRHRPPGATAFHVLGSGDSWDETLFSPAQLSFNAAWGVPTFEAGPDWTLDPAIPGASTITAATYTAPVSANLPAEGGPFTAAYFYNADSCHAQVVTPICEVNHLPPYPPPTARAEPLIFASPVCALQSSMIPFLESVLAGTTPTIAAPSGDCDDLYGR